MNKIGRYNILKRLGGGGFGEVFLGRDDHIDRDVAIKVFRPKDENLIAFATSSTEEGLELLRARFVQEARILAKLEDSPYIINVLDFGELEDGAPYYVMPFLPKSLASVIGKDIFDSGALSELAKEQHPKALELEPALHIIEQILQGLASAHSQGLVHRDIKPDNILFTEKGTIQIVDFGIAKAPDGQQSTVSHLGMGSRNYMAPEQRESAKHVDARADIYSLGVLAYRLLTGTLPVGRFVDPNVVQPGLSQGMNDLLVSLVELDKDKRPSNAAEICTAFKKGRTQQVNDPNATSATVVEAAVVKLSDELVPLKNRLQQLLLEFGEIPASANAEIEALTAIADVDDGSVKTLIKQLTKENAKEIIPKINFVKHLKQVIANSSKGLDEGTLQALKQAGTSAGFAGEQVDTLFTTHQQRQQQQDEGEEYSKPNKVSAEPTAAQNHASAERETAPVHENPKSKVQLIFGVLLLVLGLGSYFAFQLYQSQQSEQLALAQKQKTEQDLTSQEQRDLAKNANGRSQQTIVGNYSDRKTDEAQEPATYRLWVNATPNNAKIVLLDIKPSYSPGVSLEPRQQRIKVKADGYHEKMLTVDLRTQDQTIDVVLEEIVLTKQDVLKDILNLADAREFIIENPRSPFLQDVKSQEYPYKVSEFGYDKNGKLESKIDYKYDRFGNEIELFSRNRSILDKNGNIKPLFEMVRQYDSSYQLIALKNYSYSSGSRSLSASVNYSNTYYGNGKLKQQVEINTKSGSRSVSKYNKYGRFISKECVKNCNQFSHKIKIEEQTNSKGLVTKSITYYNDLKATVSTKRYNSLDKLISASDQSYKWLSIASTDNMGALERKSEFSYAYSPSGHLKTLSMKTKSFDQSGKMTGTSGSTMNYDKYGVPESFDISINGVIHSKKRYQYAFKQFDFH